MIAGYPAKALGRLRWQERGGFIPANFNHSEII